MRLSWARELCVCQARLPEVVVSLLVGVGAAAAVHRVSVTVCLLTAGALLYAALGISARRYAVAAPSVAVPVGKKRK